MPYMDFRVSYDPADPPRNKTTITFTLHREGKTRRMPFRVDEFMPVTGTDIVTGSPVNDLSARVFVSFKKGTTEGEVYSSLNPNGTVNLWLTHEVRS